ncbi:hypothetical protein ASPBRDRAFT_77386 [Aspergillus brasiliensis CBS 101740]|uniref:Uncharacterized protein n=1 Tax=Aspergillus brasiliensis (strain CBS 101740 / IMI 381727 / IBT 21946) TaxID=767769 RepID=A0A1L9UBS5_ASPBC|nr:hypothetical protein ASPBRDRAFT_77386 [Aspergillus brasiliensis CBS 101740]
MRGTRLVQCITLDNAQIAGVDHIRTWYQYDSFAAAWAVQSSIDPRSHGSGGPHDYVVTGGRDLLSLRNHHFADRR